MSDSRYSNTSWNNQQRRTIPTVKNIFAGTIYGVSGDISSSYILTASSQDVALAPSGTIFRSGWSKSRWNVFTISDWNKFN